MRHAASTRLCALAILLAPALALAQPDDSAGAGDPGGREDRRPSVDTFELLRNVASSTGLDFVLDPRLPSRMTAVGGSIEEPSLADLQAILRANRWSTIEIAGETFVLPAQETRAAPTRVLNRDDRSVSDHEIVTRVIRVPNANNDGTSSAAQLIPVLRPMLPQEAHLAASGDHVIIVDRYDNVRRISAVIEAMMN